MFWTFFWFELKLRFRSISTYIFFAIPFFMMFFSVSVEDFSPIGAGKVLLNGPYALLNTFGQLTGFGSILIAAIFGPAILRDFQQDTYALIFTKPAKKFDYLGGKWLASFVVDTAKRQSDGSGNETPMALNDLIDVGVFSGEKEHLKPLHMEKHRFSTDRSTLEIVVNEQPTFAGIDPYNKLIDRNPEDNLIPVEQK
jgi:hypothetical protein